MDEWARNVLETQKIPIQLLPLLAIDAILQHRGYQMIDHASLLMEVSYRW